MDTSPDADDDSVHLHVRMVLEGQDVYSPHASWALFKHSRTPADINKCSWPRCILVRMREKFYEASRSPSVGMDMCRGHHNNDHSGDCMERVIARIT